MKRVDIKTGFLCNNNCLFCVQADNKLKGNRSFEEIKQDLIDSSSRCEGVVFTGGEVTIRKDFFELIKLAKELGYKTIQIQTNGRMFCSMEFCKKAMLAGATEISPAIHGYCSEQHDYLTKAPGSFKQVVQGVRNLKKLGAIIIINSVIVKQNYRDLPKLAKLFVKLDVDQYQFAFVHHLGHAKTNINMITPIMSLAVPFIVESLKIGERAGKVVMVEAIPYCLLKGYERFSSEQYIPDTEIKGKSFQNTLDYKQSRILDGKIKFDFCSKCKYSDICEGPWKEYPQKYGSDEFKPIID